MDLYMHSRIRLHSVVLNLLNTGTTLPYPIYWFYKGKTNLHKILKVGATVTV
jgi:hypothetical protein